MDGQTDGWKKWHIEVGAPPKKSPVKLEKDFRELRGREKSCKNLKGLFIKNLYTFTKNQKVAHSQIDISSTGIDKFEENEMMMKRQFLKDTKYD